jgi:hypothetical protein
MNLTLPTFDNHLPHVNAANIIGSNVLGGSRMFGHWTPGLLLSAA